MILTFKTQASYFIESPTILDSSDCFFRPGFMLKFLVQVRSDSVLPIVPPQEACCHSIGDGKFDQLVKVASPRLYRDHFCL